MDQLSRIKKYDDIYEAIDFLVENGDRFSELSREVRGLEDEEGLEILEEKIDDTLEFLLEIRDDYDFITGELESPDEEE